MNDQQPEVIAWWYGRRDYSTGIGLLSKYCKNKTIVHTLNKPGKENFISSVQKLHYEVTKAVHLDWLHMPKDPSPDFQAGEKTHEVDNLKNSIPGAKNKPADGSIFREIIEKTEDLSQYPKVIRRLKYEYSSLYNKRSMLHADMRKVEEKNVEKNNTLRKTLLTEIKSISKMLALFFSFIDAFDKKGVVPEEETIWGVVKPPEPDEPKTLAQLKQMKWALQSETAKDRSRLLYRQRTKGEKENPMPAGPKREAIELRLKLREQKMAEITQQIAALENAG